MITSLLLASGCTLGCTQAGCDDGTNVSIHGLEAGHRYEIDIATEDAFVQCTVVTSDAFSVTCDNALYYGGQLPEVYIDLDGTPARVAITVRQDGLVIADDEGSPDYRSVAPNGEACGPVCRRGEVALAL